MKSNLTTIIAFWTVVGQAATVEWGGLTGPNWHYDSTERHWSGIVTVPENYRVSTGDTICPWLSLIGNQSADKARIVLSAEENGVLEYGDNWVRMNEGDLVDKTTTQNADTYFIHAISDPVSGACDIHADDIIECPIDASFRFYLGFATSVCIEKYDETGMFDQRIYYGWAQFEWGNGSLSLVNSAINSEGGGIYVGTDRTTPVPEPSSAAFAVLGVALLLRRRRLPPDNPLLE